MSIEEFTEELEEWLEKAEDEENIKFIKGNKVDSIEGATVVEILGNYGSVGQLITKEIQKLSTKSKKIGGFFSTYFSEMVQLISDEILLPVTLQQIQLGNQTFILTTCSSTIPDVIGYRLAQLLYEFYNHLKISKIVLIDGVHSFSRRIDKKPFVHKISFNKSQIQILNEFPSSFTLMGQVASSFLTYWEYRNKIPVEIIAVDSFSAYDPISSLELFKALTKEWGVNGDFTELERRSREFTLNYHQNEENPDIDGKNDVIDPRFFM